MPRLFWPLLAATLATWLAMNLGTVPQIEALSDGARLLDMRFTGYSFAEARNFVAAIGDEGAILYLGAQFWLDMIFPPLLGAVLVFCYLRLFPGRIGFVAVAGAVLYVVVDYLENFAIAAMLRMGADALTQQMAESANLWTTVKWSLALAGLVALIIGVALRLRQRYFTA